MPNSSASPHALHIALRRDKNPGGARNRLQQNRGYRVRAFALNHPPQMGQRALALLLPSALNSLR